MGVAISESVRDGEPVDDAPETNPDEMVWQHTKHGRLSNFTPENTAELRAKLIEEFGRIRAKPELLAAFIRHAKVPVRLRRY